MKEPNRPPVWMRMVPAASKDSAIRWVGLSLPHGTREEKRLPSLAGRTVSAQSSTGCPVGPELTM